MDAKKHPKEYSSKCPKAKCKSLDIPQGNLVLLWDHLEGCNNIQDKYKESEFVMVHKHVVPNVYKLKPVDGKGQMWTVNSCRLLTDVNYRTLKEPKKTKDLMVLILLSKGDKYPYIIPK